MTAGSRHSLDPVETPRFFNPYGEIRFTKNLLPHWQQNGATYFITFRLADSVPTHLRTQWEEERATWLRFHPEPWDVRTELEYHKRFTGAIEKHKSPLGVVWGALDPVAVYPMTDKLLEARPDARRITLDDVGHFPMLEDAQRTADAIVSLLS